MEKKTELRIVFDKKDVIVIDKYIKFRRSYYNFDKEELEKIIDGVLTSEDKLNLRKFKGMDAKKIITIVKMIKQDWNKSFGLGYNPKTEDWQFYSTYNQIESRMKLDVLRIEY